MQQTAQYRPLHDTAAGVLMQRARQVSHFSFDLRVPRECL